MKTKTETVIMIHCKIFSCNKYVGDGYTIVRANGRTQAFYSNDRGYELPAGYYNVKHIDDTRLAVMNRTIQ